MCNAVEGNHLKSMCHHLATPPKAKFENWWASCLLLLGKCVLNKTAFTQNSILAGLVPWDHTFTMLCNVELTKTNARWKILGKLIIWHWFTDQGNQQTWCIMWELRHFKNVTQCISLEIVFRILQSCSFYISDMFGSFRIIVHNYCVIPGCLIKQNKTKTNETDSTDLHCNPTFCNHLIQFECCSFSTQT